MSTIISPRQHITHVSYALAFAWKDSPGCGFAFPCDAHGVVIEPLCEAAAANLADCLSGAIPVTPLGVETYTNSYSEPAVLRCDCGDLVELYSPLVNSCDCGREYNMSGQRLAPRAQWGEETGESVSDILMGNAPSMY